MTHKIVCVGRNYADHASELGNAIPSSPVLFMKPWDNLADLTKPIQIPTHLGGVHHELEIIVEIGQPLKAPSKEQARQAIRRIGLGLDLTLRDIQNELKNKRLPWERAKCFIGSCPIAWATIDTTLIDLNHLSLRFFKNRTQQQSGNSAQMLFSIVDLIRDISRQFTLQMGDIIMTGTPAGVSTLSQGDQLRCELCYHPTTNTTTHTTRHTATSQTLLTIDTTVVSLT
ncbi:fumarylacetoacetate hydrolase family protein [Ostreibacterium oceani]|uniref:Isomerase/hydrolase n=1 Tax=Ostreibacterium oceani TaxID=2654998 RepID=A0A6N7EVR5_9GAMM|nr:fumarylacetoacetate hydrolase family protein [Ostreibacterium oceani]MPV85685.1 isomerase/hydrolase [Ostreibacterium oceani]